MANPENKIHFLGKDFTPREVVLGGIILAFGGVWARFHRSIAIPAILAGAGMMAVGIHKMEQKQPQPR